MNAGVQDGGTIGDAVQIERVVFKLPTYGPFGQSSAIVIEAARHCIRAQKPDKAVDLLTKAAAQPQALTARLLRVRMENHV